MKCSICKEIVDECGNNPEPIKSFKEGLCCDECNHKYVIPARLSQFVKLNNVKNKNGQN